MAPAVPFALLGVVQLVAVAGWLGLAVTALFPRLRRRTTPFVVVGGLLLAAADTVPGVQFGSPDSDRVAWLRVAGLALLAVGLAGDAVVGNVVPQRAAAVVVPLGARAVPAAVGAVAAALAAAATAVRGRRVGVDRAVGGLLAAALVLTGVAAALAAPARTSTRAALAELAVRALATVALAAVLTLLARRLLLGKIAGAMLAAVVVMAAGAVGTVGTGVAQSVQSQQSQRLLSVASSQAKALGPVRARAQLFAQVVASQCPRDPRGCRQFLDLFNVEPSYFAALVRRGAGAQVLAPSSRALGHVELVELAGSAAVTDALKSDASPLGGSDLLLLRGAGESLAVVAAAPARPGAPAGSTRGTPTFAAVYGVPLDATYLRSAGKASGFDLTVVADGRVLASSLPPAQAANVLAAARSAGVDQQDPDATRVVAAEGRNPAVAFVGVTPSENGDVRIATLAASQPADAALAAQRSVLRRLFVTALAVLVIVAVLSLALGRRIAEPVRRLTVAAARVRGGDLTAHAGVSSSDEVGALSRAFDAMTGSLRHLTDELRGAADAEAALRARLETVVGSMSDGLLVTDDAGVVTTANPMALHVLGRDEADIVGRPLRAVLDTAVAREPVDTELTRGDGSTVPVRVSAAPLESGHGEVVVLADRTRDREVERMKTEFLSNVSHELRTPLTPIRGYAEMLARRPDLPPERTAGFVAEILAATGRMSRAVELLVDVAALEAGRVSAQPRRTPAASLVDERLTAWRARYPERAADFTRRVAARLPDVDVDVRWVAKALDEFADNAVKYTPAGTAITVLAARGEDGVVRVGVRDRGPGLDAERLPDLLGDFSQADASETRQVGGLGLGLGFVTRVCARLGLRLDVSSTPKRGAEFVLELPVSR